MMATASDGQKNGRGDDLSEKKGRISLRALFSGLVILTFVMTLVITLFASYRSEKQLLTERVLSTNLSESQRIGHTMDMLFVSIRDSLAAFTSEMSEIVLDGSSDRIGDELQQIYKSSSYLDSVFIAGTNGEIRQIYSESSAVEVGKDEQNTLNAALKRSESGLSLPYKDPNGQMMVLMSEPLYSKDGMNLGVVGGTIRLEDPLVISSLFGIQNMESTDSYYYVVDSEGKLVYHPDRSRIGESLLDSPVISRILRGESGKSEVIGKDGRAFLVGYTSVSSNNWGIVTQTPDSVLQRQQLQQIRGTLAAVLLPFLILVVGTLFLARQLAAPFVALADFVVRAAERPQEAEAPAVRRHWNREADLLNRAVMRSVMEMKRQNRSLTDSALRDALTGLLNRRALDEALEKMEENNRPFALLLFDIDSFKAVNDRYGHAAGDEVLRSVALTLEKTLENGDICGRYGGEEFLVILPDRSLPETYEMAERIRLAVAANENSLHIPVTISVGASISPQQSTRIDDLFELADRALYSAKEGGRNRVVM